MIFGVSILAFSLPRDLQVLIQDEMNDFMQAFDSPYFLPVLHVMLPQLCVQLSQPRLVQGTSSLKNVPGVGISAAEKEAQLKEVGKQRSTRFSRKLQATQILVQQKNYRLLKNIFIKNRNSCTACNR